MKIPIVILCILWDGLGGLIAIQAQGSQQLPASALTANAVRQYVQEHQKFIFVDIRSPQAFAQVRIPGSLNMSLFAVKTKNFLKGKSLVLLDEGLRPRQLAKACEQLTQAGFEAHFLVGGLAAWQTSGGRLQGNAFARNRVNRLSPRAWFAAQEDADWLVVEVSVDTLPTIPGEEPGDVSADTLPESQDRNSTSLPLSEEGLFSQMRSVPFDRDRPEQFAVDIADAVRQSSSHAEYLLVVICHRDGKDYQALERALPSLENAPVFFLEGGMDAFIRYVDQQHSHKQTRQPAFSSTCRRPCCAH